MLSQFMNVESVFLEVKRVLAPGGIFLFAEEPLKRLLTLGLYRCPYYESMKPWERRLYRWGLLGFLVRDVIGAGQEESEFAAQFGPIGRGALTYPPAV
ncbi:MAG: hypothetical protein HP495_02745 [Nitrospira sp.]|nr:hypothetical protein [Nitrospira sp.]